MVAVGHPLGVQHAVTAGIISAVPNPEGPRALLRSDLHLNPGNSGGPLVDALGRVIGINAMVAGPGTALSVPSHTVAALLARVSGRSARLGAELIPLPQSRGLMIGGIEPGSLAERLRLFPGDVILHVASPLQLRERLALVSAERPLTLTISRAGSVFEVEATAA